MAGGAFTEPMHDQTRVAAVSAVSHAEELPLSSLLIVAALSAAVVGQGAYYRLAQVLVAVLLVASACTFLAQAGRAAIRPTAFIALGTALAGWSVVSATLAGDWTASRSTVLLVAGIVVVVVTGQHLGPDARRQLADSVVALGAAVAVAGWIGVAWHHPPWGLVDQGLWRAATTVTYANAAGGLLAMVALVALAQGCGSPRSAPTAVATCLILTGLGLTLSRGGLIAFLAGTLVLGRTLGISRLLRGAAAPVVGAIVALAGAVPSIPASSPARPGVALCGLAVAAVLAATTARQPRATVALGAAAAALALPLMLVTAGWSPILDAGRRVADTRLSAASPDRVDEARAALRSAAERPLTGAGPGRADLSWQRPDGSRLIARYAHNEYLQTLADLGVVGLALVVALLVAVARLALRDSGTAPTGSLWAGAAAGMVAFAVQGLFDFGWHLPAIPLTGALLVGIAIPQQRQEDV